MAASPLIRTRGSDGLRPGQQLLEQRAALAQPAALVVPAPDGADDPQPVLGLPVGQRPVDGGPQVVVLDVQPREPRRAHPGPNIRALGRGGDPGAQRDEPPLRPRPARRPRRAARARTRAAAGGGRTGARRPLPGGPRAPGSCRRATRGRPARRSRGRRPGPPRRGRPRRPSRSRTRRAGRTAGAPRADRSSWLHAIAPRSVRCRSGRSRAPPPRSRLRCSRSRICAGASIRTRAAASSSASGQPAEPLRDRPHRRHPVRVEDEVRARRPRAVEEQRHAGLGPERRHPVLVLARDPQHLAARRQHPQLGRAPDQVRDALRDGRQQLLEVVEDEQRRSSRRWARRASSTVRSVDSRMPSDPATDGSSWAASWTAARSTNHTPCGNRSRTERAVASASLVLPLPPGPVRVTTRLARSWSPQPLDLGVAADERRHVAREVRRDLGGAQGPRVVGGARDDEAVERAAAPRSP